MSTPHLLMWAIVLVVGVPSAWRNPTAAALVLCWVVSEGIYALTGNGLAVEYFAYPDIFVIAIIFAKPECRDLSPYASTWHQMKCVLLERSPSDGFILLSYPVVWTLYVAGLHPYYQYWALYLISVAQFLAAGWESLSKHLRRHAEAREHPPEQGPLLFALLGGGRGG